MCQYSAVDGRRRTTGTWCTSGRSRAAAPGLVMTEATAVSPEGRISPADTGHLGRRAARRLAPASSTSCTARAPRAGIQLAHAGRKASTDRPFEGRGTVPRDEGGWETVRRPRPMAFPGYAGAAGADRRRASTQVVADFAAAARRRARRGRASTWSRSTPPTATSCTSSSPRCPTTAPTSTAAPSTTGSALAAAGGRRASAAVVPERLPAARRGSPRPTGSRAAGPSTSSVALARLLRERRRRPRRRLHRRQRAGARIPVGPGYQVPFARRIREEAGMPTAAVGLITEPEQAEEIVADGRRRRRAAGPGDAARPALAAARRPRARGRGRRGHRLAEAVPEGHPGLKQSVPREEAPCQGSSSSAAGWPPPRPWRACGTTGTRTGSSWSPTSTICPTSDRRCPRATCWARRRSTASSRTRPSGTSSATSTCGSVRRRARSTWTPTS